MSHGTGSAWHPRSACSADLSSLISSYAFRPVMVGLFYLRRHSRASGCHRGANGRHPRESGDPAWVLPQRAVLPLPLAGEGGVRVVIPAEATVIPAPDRSPGQAPAGTSASSSSPPRIGVRGRLQRGPAPRRHSRASGNPGVFSLSPLAVETVCPPSTPLPSSSATWPIQTQTLREPPPRTARARHSYSLSFWERAG